MSSALNMNRRIGRVKCLMRRSEALQISTVARRQHCSSRLFSGTLQISIPPKGNLRRIPRHLQQKRHHPTQFDRFSGNFVPWLYVYSVISFYTFERREAYKKSKKWNNSASLIRTRQYVKWTPVTDVSLHFLWRLSEAESSRNNGIFEAETWCFIGGLRELYLLAGHFSKMAENKTLAIR